MKILYIAYHDYGHNDDEGAIAYALEKLGHEVVKVKEFGETIPLDDLAKLDQTFDFCLFHKWSNVSFIKRLKCPKVFWYFDLVDWPQDLTLASRCEWRKRWMAEVIPLVDLGFCTDGDWVERYNDRCFGSTRGDFQPKLVTLRQGADERVIGPGDPGPPLDKDVLFVGSVKGCGVKRESFVRELQDRYGDRLQVITHGIYRRDLADLIAKVKVVVCPDSPVTDKYWSNRIYVMAGFGACIVHPFCWGINSARDYVAGVLGYPSRADLFDYIDGLVADAGKRKEMARLALADVQDRHLYRHRVEQLISILRDRGVI